MILMSFSIKSFDQIIRDGFKRNSKRNLEVGGWGVGGGKQACFTMHQISEKCCYDPLRSLSQSLVCENTLNKSLKEGIQLWEGLRFIGTVSRYHCVIHVWILLAVEIVLL